MESRRVTLRDVAKAANVSLTAVSFYINERPGISTSTRNRIAAAIEQLGYVPRRNGGSVGFIGLLIERLPLSPFSDMFYGEVLQGIETRARNLDYNVALMTVEGSGHLSRLFEQHASSLVGLVILGGGDNSAEVIENAMQQPIPSILVDTDTTAPRMHSIMPDYIRGAYEATNHLIAKGHQRIAFIQGSNKYRSLVERFHGYACALLDAGIPIDHNLIQPAISSGIPNKGFREMKALLEGGHEFDAVFCASDRTALGALDALRDKQIRVPEDLALMGFDNVAQSGHTMPPLTTVDVFKTELGVRAIDILHQQINDSSEQLAVRTLTQTQLVVRQSA